MTRVQPGLLARRLAAIRRGLRQGRTLAYIGRELGLTRERVRQLCIEHGMRSPGVRKRSPSRRQLLERLAANGQRGRWAAEMAILAEQRGYAVEIGATSHGYIGVWIEGLRVHVHRCGLMRRGWVHVTHEGYHRASWVCSKPPVLALVAWPDGLELHVVDDDRWHFRYRRIDGLTPLRDWPEPAEIRAAAVRMRRAA